MNNQHLHTEFPDYQDFKLLPTTFRNLQNFYMCT